MRMLCLLSVAVVGWSGCSVDVEVASLSFVSPAPGATYTRDQLAASGSLVASVGVEVDVGGDIERVALTAGDVSLGDLAVHTGQNELLGETLKEVSRPAVPRRGKY